MLDPALIGNRIRSGQNRSWLGFVVLFGVFMLVYYELSFTRAFNAFFVSPCASAAAKSSWFLLRLLGQPVVLLGNSLHSPMASFSVTNDCSSVEQIWVFAAAVLAFPAPFKRKIPVVLLGTLLIFVTNVARIVMLFFVMSRRPLWFETAHLEVCPAIFIAVTVCAWWLWLPWLNQKGGSGHHA